MIFKREIKKTYIYILIVLTIFLLDRVSKIIVLSLFEEKNYSKLYSSKFLDINLIWNEGIAFGILSFNEKYLYNILTSIIILIIVVIILMITKSYGLKKYSLILILGGALGNVFDRLIYKSVPDFIDFHVGDFHWFIFNVADIFISIGIIFMIILEFIGKNSKNTHEMY